MTDAESVTNQQINTIVVNTRGYDPAFVYYRLVADRDWIKAKSGGAATPIISKSAFENLGVCVPPLTVQRKIATILSAYDDLIENNNHRIKSLGEMIRMIYQEWFIDFRYPGYEHEPLVEADLGFIPENWDWARIGDLVEDVRDRVQPSAVDPNTPYLGLEHFPERSIAIQEWGCAFDVKSTKLRFSSRDILFGKIRPYFHKVGRAPTDGICSTDTIVLRPRSEVLANFALAVISSEAFVGYAVQISQGTKMPRANWKVLQEYAVAIPPPELATRLAQVLDDMTAALRPLVLANRNLQETRDLLLPRLISGEIDVEEFDSETVKLAA